MIKQKVMAIAWPAFLMACVIEMLVFAFVDPMNLSFFGHIVTSSAEAIYTAAFFCFWFVTMLSSALTVLLLVSPYESDSHSRRIP